MAEIALAVERALAQRAADGTPGRAVARVIAETADWRVSDVICSSGPRDRAFEEQHARPSIAIVAAGSFQYRSTFGSELMTPGALLLGNDGHAFECGHEHGAGDRCIAFHYAPEFFARLASDAGLRHAGPHGTPDAGRSRGAFHLTRLPPLRETAPIVARACAGLAGSETPWDELAVTLAARALQIARGLAVDAGRLPAHAVARVTRIVRRIERQPDAPLPLGALAEEARLSPYHFLRTFERITGVTPHQYVLRARLRRAALRLAGSSSHVKVVDIALDSGFGDVSNFNRAFRAEFGVSPRTHRRLASAVESR